MSKEKYFNFPVQLLEGFMINPNKVINDINDYAVYENSLKLEFGDELEKIKASASFYNMTLGNPEKTLNNGENLYNTIPDNSPKVGLNLSIWWDFYKNEKKEFEKICFLGFLAIKSILGSKPYCKTDNKFWLSRMSGQIKSVSDISELPNEILNYSTEYQTKKIKTELRNNWGLKTYSRHTRGFYVSFKMSLEQLIFEAEKRRISTKEKQYKKKEKEIVNKVLEQIEKT